MSGTKRELTVSVNLKLSSDQLKVLSSPAGMPGSPLLTSVHGPGSVGGGNSYGGTSPIVEAENEHKKRLQAHSDRLKGFTDDITKAAVGLSYLSGSTSSFSKGLEKAANALAAIAVASSGISAGKALLSPSMWKSAGALLANPGTALLAGGAAGLGSIGYGLYSGREDGTSYMGGYNRWHANTFGGGKVNSRGNWISQDQQLDTIHHQFNERMRRNAMQSPMDMIEIQGRESQYALIDQMHDIKMQGMSYKGYASDAVSAEKKHRKLFDDNIASSRNVYESVYGKQIGGLMAKREMYSADLQSQVFGAQEADILKDQRLSKMKGSALQWQLARAHSNFNDAADSRDGDMKASGFKTDKMKEEWQNVLRINDDIKKNKLEQLELDKKMADLTTKALQAKKADTDSRLSTARDIVTSGTQALEGMKESYGKMDIGQRQWMQDAAKRAKEGGLDAVTIEERDMLSNSPMGEDIRRMSIERAEKDPGFADMYRGSRMEANINKAQNQAEMLEKLSVDIKQQINAKVEIDPQVLTERFVEAMAPVIAKMTLAISKAVTISKDMADNNAMATGIHKTPTK